MFNGGILNNLRQGVGQGAQSGQQGQGLLAGLRGGQTQGGGLLAGGGGLLFTTMKFSVVTKDGKCVAEAHVKIFGPIGMRPIAEGDTWTITQNDKGEQTVLPTAFKVPKGRHPYEITIKGCTGSIKQSPLVMNEFSVTHQIEGG